MGAAMCRNSSSIMRRMPRARARASLELSARTPSPSTQMCGGIEFDEDLVTCCE